MAGKAAAGQGRTWFIGQRDAGVVVLLPRIEDRIGLAQHRFSLAVHRADPQATYPRLRVLGNLIMVIVRSTRDTDRVPFGADNEMQREVFLGDLPVPC